MLCLCVRQCPEIWLKTPNLCIIVCEFITVSDLWQKYKIMLLEHAFDHLFIYFYLTFKATYWVLYSTLLKWKPSKDRLNHVATTQKSKGCTPKKKTSTPLLPQNKKSCLTNTFVKKIIPMQCRDQKAKVYWEVSKIIVQLLTPLTTKCNIYYLFEFLTWALINKLNSLRTYKPCLTSCVLKLRYENTCTSIYLFMFVLQILQPPAQTVYSKKSSIQPCNACVSL